jgi:Leucine-rich repeat (LRR) protein
MTEKTEHEDLPAVVCPNLTRIQLQSNEFCFVPDSVCKLEKLNGLDLSHNKKILQLPLEMGRLNMLYDLFLDGLLLVDPPPHIIQQKTVDIIGFLRQRLKQ